MKTIREFSATMLVMVKSSSESQIELLVTHSALEIIRDKIENTTDKETMYNLLQSIDSIFKSKGHCSNPHSILWSEIAGEETLEDIITESNEVSIRELAERIVNTFYFKD